MDWIFKKQEKAESEESKWIKALEELMKKKKKLGELLDFTTNNSRLVSEEEVEYLKAYPTYEGNGIFESEKYDAIA